MYRDIERETQHGQELLLFSLSLSYFHLQLRLCVGPPLPLRPLRNQRLGNHRTDRLSAVICNPQSAAARVEETWWVGGHGEKAGDSRTCAAVYIIHVMPINRYREETGGVAALIRRPWEGFAAAQEFQPSMLYYVYCTVLGVVPCSR